MSEKVYAVPAEWSARAEIDETKYQAMMKRSLEDPNGFWGEVASARILSTISAASSLNGSDISKYIF